MKKPVLVVDDDTRITDFLKLAIEDSGEFEVTVMNQPLKAVETAKRIQPVFVFLDVEMPHLTGGDIAFQMRSEVSLKNVPIVFLTGMATEEDIKESNLIAGYPFLVKPVKSEQVLECLRKYIKK